MSALLLIAALLSSSATGSNLGSNDGPALGPSLMQRLRGAKASITSVVFPGADTEPMDQSVAKERIAGQRFSDDDESCSAAGITPGVCALEWLAQPTMKLPASPKFRHSKAAADCDEKESTERLERALIAEIDAGLAGNHTGFDDARLQELEKELQPTFATLPHEAPLADLEGGLGLASARYLLHQHFLRQHSWYVRGLNPAGDGRQPPDHKEGLRSRVAGHLLEVMEKRVGNQGLNLKTLAVFVATLEHLIHGDERQRLKAAWAVHDLNQDDITDSGGLRSVLEMFMAHYVFVSQKADSGYVLTLEQGQTEVKAMAKGYDGWDMLTSFMQEQIDKRRHLSGADLSFEDAAQAAARVLEFFREVSGSMCHDMERTFTTLPGGDSGRISLAAMRHSGDLVRESTEYLRSSHALDESDATNPQILLPNYMLGISNCDGTTSFYDLCCPNACEGRKEHLEKSLAAAEGTTDAAAVVREAVQEQRWAVPSELLEQLDEISQSSGGKAMIHGLRFARWLHSAFPRECPRPVDSDFAAGDVVPDAKADFQESAKVESLFDW